MAVYNITVNGKLHSVDIDDPNTPLLYVLQENVQTKGPRFGCGLGQCGCCTVLLDGEPIRSCITAISDSDGHSITTIEGLGTVENPHPIQQAFITEQAMHCGYCLSGPMLYGYAFIQQNPNATQADILNALSGLLCRCHSHVRMVNALVRYAQESA
jgi:nicotinate dehydrogenase subunit A